MSDGQHLHILLVCPYFAPENTIAAVRLSKFAEHWCSAGHQVTVLTRQETGTDGLGVDKRIKVVRVVDPTVRLHQAAVGGRYDEAGLQGSRLGVRRFAASVARRLSPWPDRFAIWAMRARHVDVARPDLVFASGGPLSSLLLGAFLARRFKVPWVADYRDLLSSGGYLQRSPVRRLVESAIERRAVGTAAALTSVSEPMSESLERWVQVPARTVLNGFDPDDYPEPDGRADRRLRILYCGEIYRDKRDPSPLFEALARLDPWERERVVVDFYGASVDHVGALAAAHGLVSHVRTHERVPYRQALALQQEADVLLSLLWDDAREGGVYSGKLFEYVGAGRPVIALGWEKGVAARLVRERRLGIASNDPERLRSALSEWIQRKMPGELLPWDGALPTADLTREAQSLRALEVLCEAATAGLTS